MSSPTMAPAPPRTALLPALAAGAAVALALLALSLDPAGPGGWLLTGVQSRWKWGGDWTPEFGPWGWLLFAPSTGETWLWQGLFALAGGAAAALGFDAAFARGRSGLPLGAAAAVVFGALLIPGSAVLLPPVLCGWGLYRALSEGRETAGLVLGAALGSWAMVHRDATFVALGSGMLGAAAGWRTLRWRALIPLAFAGICLTGWWGAALQPLTGLGAWLAHGAADPDAFPAPYRNAATLPALLLLLCLGLAVALGRCRHSLRTTAAVLLTLALAVRAATATYGNPGVAAVLALCGTLAGLAATAPDEAPSRPTRRTRLPVVSLAALALWVGLEQWPAAPLWSLGRIAAPARPLPPELGPVVSDPWMQILLRGPAAATADAWAALRLISASPQPHDAPARLVRWAPPAGQWSGAHALATLRALGDTQAVAAEFSGGCVLLPNRHRRPVEAPVALPAAGRSGEEIDLTAGAGRRLWLRIGIHPTLFGRLAGPLLGRVPLRLVAVDADGHTVAGLLTCAEAAGEFLVAPLVVTADDLVRCGDGRSDARRPVRLRIELPGRSRTWLREDFDLQWRATTVAPAQAGYPDWVFLNRGWTFPGPSDYTGRITPVDEPSAHRFTTRPPGEVVLVLPPNPRRLRGAFGLQVRPGASDVRMRFAVAARRDGRDQPLFERTLAPLLQPADREAVPLLLDLTGRSGELVLRIEAASAGAAAQGLPFWQELAVDRFPSRVSTPPTRELVIEGAGFDRLPASILAYTLAVPEVVAGRKALFAHAPSEIVVAVPAGAGRVTGAFGFTPGAYTPPNGRTDGAVFVVRWEPAGGAPRDLVRRFLDPLGNPLDRGLQDFTAGLDGAAGGTLRLITEPGAADNLQFDWTVWSEVRIK